MAVESSKKSPPLPWPALIPLGHHAGKPAISLAKAVMLVGSRSNAHLHLMSRHVSKAHALILSWQGQVYIRDLASREKVYINGREVREAWLKDRDLIKIGSFTFKYKDGPKKGAMADPAMAPADLEVDGADAPLSVAEKVMLIGRRQTCDVSLMEASVSTAHAVLFHLGGKRYVRDLGSRSGTFVNGTKVHQHELTPGDSIRIGETDLRYVLAGEDSHSIRPATEDEAFAFTAVTADEPEVDFTGETEPTPVEENLGEPEMIPVHAEDESRVSVTPPHRGASREELDELEDLVGTAPLDVGAEIERERRTTTAGQGRSAQEVVEQPAAASDPDLIAMDWDEAPAATPTPAPSLAPAPMPPRPLPATPPAPPRPAGKVPGAVAVAAGSVAAAEFLRSSASVTPVAPLMPTPVLEDKAISFESDPLNAEIESGARASDPASANAVNNIDAELDLLGLDFEPDALVAAVTETPEAAPAVAEVTPAPAATGEDLIHLDAFDEADVSEVASSEGTRAAGFDLDPEHDAAADSRAVQEASASAVAEEASPVAAAGELAPEQMEVEGEIEAQNELPAVGDHAVGGHAEAEWEAPEVGVQLPTETGAVQDLKATWSETVLPVESETTVSGFPTVEEAIASAPVAAEETGVIVEEAIEAEGVLEPDVIEEVWSEEELLEELAPVETTASDLPTAENVSAASVSGEMSTADFSTEALGPVEPAASEPAGVGEAALDHAVEAAAMGQLPLDPGEAAGGESRIVADVVAPETIDEVWVEETLPEIAGIHVVTGLGTPEVIEAPEGIHAPAKSEVEPSPELLARMEEWGADDAVSAVETREIAAAPLMPVVAEAPSTDEQTPDAFDEMFKGSREVEETFAPGPVEAEEGGDDLAGTPQTVTDVNALTGAEPLAMDHPTEAPVEALSADDEAPEPTDGAEIQEWDLNDLTELETIEEEPAAASAKPAGDASPFGEMDLVETVDSGSAVIDPPNQVSQTFEPEAPAEFQPIEALETVEEASPAGESVPVAAADLSAPAAKVTPLHGAQSVEQIQLPVAVNAEQDGAVEELADELPESLDATPENDPDLSLAEEFSAAPGDADLELIDTITAQEVLAVERPPNLTGAEDLPEDFEALDEVLQLDEEDASAEAGAIAGASATSAGLTGVSALGAVAPVDIGESVDPEQSSVTGGDSAQVGEVETLEEDSEETDEELPLAQEFLPLLDLDAGDLAPANSGRDPDALLPLEQVDPDDLDEVMEMEEIVEPTEPTAESALDLEGELEEVTLEEDLPEVEVVGTESAMGSSAGVEQTWDVEWTAAQAAQSAAGADSLSDTAFGQQVAEFTTGASNGEIVEEAETQSTVESSPSAEIAAVAELEAIEEFADLDDAGQSLAQAMSADEQAAAAEDHSFIDTTRGGIEPVLPEDFAPEAGAGEEGGAAAIVVERMNQTPVDESANDQGGSSGGFGGFTIGTDLASYIGGMPLVLPDLPPAPQFAQAQMGFETTRGPFGEARPRTAKNVALADEVMQAAKGLRDVELMDDADVQGEPQQGEAIAEYLDEEEAALFSGEGAPSDEWNLGAVLDEDESPEAPLTSESLTEADVAELEAASEGDASESNGSVTETADGFVGLTHAPLDGPVEMEALSLTGATPDAVIESEYAEPEQLEALADLVEEPVGGVPAISVANDSTVEVETEAPAAVLPVAWHETEEASAAGIDAEAAELEDEAIREAGLVGETILFREVQAEAAALAALHSPQVEDEELATPEFAEMPEEAGELVEELAPAAVEDAPGEEEAPGADHVPAVDGSPAAEDLQSEPVDSFGGAEAEAFKSAPAVETSSPPAPSPVAPASPRGLSMSDLGMGTAISVAAAGGKSVRGVSRAPGSLGAEARRAARAGQGAAANDVFSDGVGGSAAPFGGLDDVRQMDVFAQTALGPADSVFGEDVAAGAGVKPARRKAISPADSGAEAARRGRGQRAIVPPRLGVLGSGQMAAEIEVATPAFGGGFNEPAVRPVYRAPRHHRRSVGRVLAMVALLLLLIGAAIAGVWYFVKPKFTFEGVLRFNNLAALTQHQRAEFIRAQRDLLTSRVVRQNAGYYMANQSMPTGFIDRPEDFGRVKADFPDDRADALVVTYTGNDAKDLDRVAALLQAVYIENASAKDKVLRLDGEIEKFRRQIAEVKELQAKYASLKKEVDSAPSAEDVRKLEDLKQDAEIQYDIAAAAAKDAKNDVLKLESQMTPAGGAAAVGGAAPQDADLVKIQKELEAAALGLASAKASASEDADARQKALDQAVEAFQQAAANVSRENPELSQYVTAVQQLQERTHKLGGDLIARQQSTQQRLERFAKALNDSIAAERINAWAADAELNAAQIQLRFAERKLNAVTDPQSNLPPDSPEVKAAQNGLADLNKKIEARKAWIEKTMALNQAALQLAELIKENKEQLDADRKRIESDIKEQEQAFARSALVEKLPEAQRAAATALKAKQDQITELRKEYAAALARRTAESNLAVREIEGRIAKLSAQADERKRLLAAQGAQAMNQDQLVALQKKQAALKAADEQAAAARKVYLDRNKAVTAAVGSREAVAIKRTEMEGHDTDLKTRLEGLKQNELNLAASEEEKRRIVTATEPRKGDVREIERRDDRLLYSFGASAGVAVIFCVVVLLAGTGRPAAHAETTHPGPEHELAEFEPAEAGPLAIDEIGAPATERARRVKKVMR